MLVDIIIIVSCPQFATVYKARDKTTDTIVAIKKVTTFSFHLLLVMGCDADLKWVSILYFRLKLATELRQKMVSFELIIDS